MRISISNRKRMVSGTGIVAIKFTCSTIYLTAEKEESSYGFRHFDGKIGEKGNP